MPSDLQRPAAVLELDPQRNADASRQRQRKGILQLTVDIPSSYRPGAASDERRAPPRWHTPEFLFYYVAAVVAIPLMVWVPMQLSKPEHPNYPFYQHRLAPGWIGGRAVDNSDTQYRSFRSNIPYLGLLVTVFFAFKRIYTRSFLRSLSPPPADDLHLKPFLVTFSLIMLLVLHGASALKIIAILVANYTLAKVCGPSLMGPVLTWVFNGLVLFMNERHGGYQFASLFPSLGMLDNLSGIYPRWHVSFNITMLRLVSFSMDYFWACRRTGPRDTGSPLAEKQRTTTAHSLEYYSFASYLAYALYPPLYIAGPIMTFNDFMWQLRRPAPPTQRSIATYAVRFAACFLTMELLLHFTYVVAIKDAHAWVGDSVPELCLIGFWNLIIVWLKLLLPWRFFRLWALADGIDAPENMVRCMVNNYSTLGFWRSWHRSYNLWIVRYIYVPLGGSKNALFTTVLVFSFVALWHDLSFKLLAWGWLVSLFILPELACGALLPARKYGQERWYRHVCALGGVANMFMMVAANLVGFVIGLDETKRLFAQLFGTWEGMQFLGLACGCMFIAVQLMFEYREEEMRKGFFRRY